LVSSNEPLTPEEAAAAAADAWFAIIESKTLDPFLFLPTVGLILLALPTPLF